MPPASRRLSLHPPLAPALPEPPGASVPPTLSQLVIPPASCGQRFIHLRAPRNLPSPRSPEGGVLPIRFSAPQPQELSTAGEVPPTAPVGSPTNPVILKTRLKFISTRLLYSSPTPVLRESPPTQPWETFCFPASYPKPTLASLTEDDLIFYVVEKNRPTRSKPCRQEPSALEASQQLHPHAPPLLVQAEEPPSCLTQFSSSACARDTDAACAHTVPRSGPFPFTSSMFPSVTALSSMQEKFLLS